MGNRGLRMTPKQEAFARAYIETGNATEAYRQSYNAEKMSQRALEVEASRLLANPDVALRVSQIQAKHQKRHEITVDRLTDMAFEAYKEAQRVAPTSGQMQTAAMIKATEFLAKLHGHLVDRSEVKHVSGAEDLDDNELANLAVAGRRGTVKAPAGPAQSH